MESGSTSPSRPSNHVIIALDATRDRDEHELQMTVTEIQARGDILCRGDTLILLGILDKFLHPMGYKTIVSTDSFFGSSSARALEEEVSKKVDIYENMLLQSAEQLEGEEVDSKVKITAGSPIKTVIQQEVISYNATWIILDRHLRKDLKFYIKNLPCKVALLQDSLNVEVLRSSLTNATRGLEEKLFYSLSKSVLQSVQPILSVQDNVINEQSIISCGSYYASVSSQENSDFFRSNMASSSDRSHDYNFSVSKEAGNNSMNRRSGKYSSKDSKNLSNPYICQNEHMNVFQHETPEKPVLCLGCGLRTILYIKESMRFRYSEIQGATAGFSEENLLGEGGYGHVYKGQLKDGQIIAAKLRKEASSQGYTEFKSEVHVLSLARHKNIVMLLGYCCKENHNILVYEYICNRSLEWHLRNEPVLEWHKRHTIAMGTAKGLRFLHEECRGGPIIHRDLRPSNILLTHDFVPMLCDFGLAKWKSSEDSNHTRVLGTLGYLAPEYAEEGIVSVKTDVYAFGIVLLQLISGRKVVDGKSGQHQALLQWAEPLVEKLALHELIDPHIGQSYDTYELYRMAKAAYLCVRRKPELRPSMGEVVRLLEWEKERVQDLAQPFMPYHMD